MKHMFAVVCLLCFMTLPLFSGFAHAAERQNEKVLIIYYSLSGITKEIAEKLQAMTGGDLYEIQTVKTYPTTMPGLYEEPKKELEERNLPQLKNAPPDMSSYDLILVGGPVWWYTVPTPIMTFLEEADFAGKRVAAFCAYATTLGQYLPHFKEQAKNAVVLDGLHLSYPRHIPGGELNRTLESWLHSLRG